MEPTTLKDRYKTYQNESLLEEDSFEEKDNGMSDEDLKIESLKIATNICKLMNNVLPEDVVAVAEKVADFIKNGTGELAPDSTSEDETTEESDFEDVSDEDTDEEPTETEDFEEDFETVDDEGDTEETTEESEEDFEV